MAGEMKGEPGERNGNKRGDLGQRMSNLVGMGGRERSE